jgi:hypothetical protein
MESVKTKNSSEDLAEKSNHLEERILKEKEHSEVLAERV